MRLLLLLLAFASFLFAAIEAFGGDVPAIGGNPLGWVALGLVFYVLSLSPLPQPPRR